MGYYRAGFEVVGVDCKAAFDEGAFVSVTGHRGRYVSSRALGIEWMTGIELSQAVPPVYTEWLGLQLMPLVRVDGGLAPEASDS